MNHQILFLIQIILGIILVVLILLQAKGSGLGSAFGGDMGFYGTKRGAERLLFRFTLVIAAIFLILPVISLVFVK